MSTDTVGLVGDDAEETADAARRLRESLDDIEIVAGEAAEIVARRPSMFVAIGPTALPALIAASTDLGAPVLPVAGAEGFEPVSRSILPDAVAAVREGIRGTVDHPILSVERDGKPIGPAIMDVSLITSEPARISEFAIADGTDRLDDVRADGLVVATPAGSHGYAHAAGGPILRPETGVVAVVPVAPFRIQRRTWVVDPTALELSVIRDEGDIELAIDGHERRVLEPESTITFSTAGTVSTIAVDPR